MASADALLFVSFVRFVDSSCDRCPSSRPEALTTKDTKFTKDTKGAEPFLLRS